MFCELLVFFFVLDVHSLKIKKALTTLLLSLRSKGNVKSQGNHEGPINFPFDLNSHDNKKNFYVIISYRHHRNFLPVDYSLDGWPRSEQFQKIRSLPSECEHQMEMEETNNSAASWSDSTGTQITTIGRKQKTSSPKICVQRDVYRQPSIDRSFDEHSSIISEHSRSYDSQESSHFLADQELGYSHTRNPSFSSVRSESCMENVDSRTDGSANKPTLSPHHHSGMLSRSSSRSTFLSVPSKVPNSLWLSSTSDHLHQADNNKVMERQLSANSHLGSTSSLMASHFSLSKYTIIELLLFFFYCLRVFQSSDI